MILLFTKYSQLLVSHSSVQNAIQYCIIQTVSYAYLYLQTVTYYIIIKLTIVQLWEKKF